jgi:hypothetical protein
MPAAASSEVYIKFVTQGIADAGRGLSAMAASADAAGKGFSALQAKASVFSSLTKGSAAATQQLERMRRVLAEGRTSIFFSDLTTKIQGMGRVGAVTFGALTAGIGGYIRSGMQGTAESIQLNRAMTDISYSIASIFTPQIRAAVDWVQKLSYHLMNLTGAQQASARQWVAGALSLTGFLALLPRMTGGMAALTRSRSAADLAMASSWRRPAGGGAGGVPGGGMGLPGVGGLPIIGGLLGGLGSLGALALLAGSSEEGRKALSDLATATAPLVQSFSALIPVVGALAKGFAVVTQWAMNLPGGGPGRVSPLGAAGQAGLIGGIVAAMRSLPAGATRLGMFTAGAAFTAPIAAALAGISNAKADSIENQTDIEELKRRLDAFRRDKGGMLPAQLGMYAGYEARIEARIKELQGGKAKDMLEPFTPGFERPEDLYRRIAEAASGDKSPEKLTAENTKAIRESLQAVLDSMRAAGMKLPLDRPGEE